MRLVEAIRHITEARSWESILRSAVGAFDNAIETGLNSNGMLFIIGAMEALSAALKLAGMKSEAKELERVNIAINAANKSKKKYGDLDPYRAQQTWTKASKGARVALKSAQEQGRSYNGVVMVQGALSAIERLLKSSGFAEYKQIAKVNKAISAANRPGLYAESIRNITESKFYGNPAKHGSDPRAEAEDQLGWGVYGLSEVLYMLKKASGKHQQFWQKVHDFMRKEMGSNYAYMRKEADKQLKKDLGESVYKKR